MKVWNLQASSLPKDQVVINEITTPKKGLKRESGDSWSSYSEQESEPSSGNMRPKYWLHFQVLMG